MKKILYTLTICGFQLVSAADYAKEAIQLAYKGQWVKVYQLLDESKITLEQIAPDAHGSLLVHAAIDGHEDAVQELLKRGANPNNNVVITPLMGAIWGHLQQRKDTIGVMRILLSHGADPRVKDRYDRNCFVYIKGFSGADYDNSVKDAITRLLYIDMAGSYYLGYDIN